MTNQLPYINKKAAPTQTFAASVMWVVLLLPFLGFSAGVAVRLFEWVAR